MATSEYYTQQGYSKEEAGYLARRDYDRAKYAGGKPTGGRYGPSPVDIGQADVGTVTTPTPTEPTPYTGPGGGPGGGARYQTAPGIYPTSPDVPASASEHLERTTIELSVAERKLHDYQTSVEAAPPHLRQRRYDDYRRFYEEEYLPLHRQHTGYIEQHREDIWKPYSSQLRDLHLTETDISRIEVSWRRIGATVTSQEEFNRRWRTAFTPWEYIITQRVAAGEGARYQPMFVSMDATEAYFKSGYHLYEQKMGYVEPAWEAYYRSTGDPIGAGVVKAFDWTGKGVAELFTGRLFSDPIMTSTPKVQFSSEIAPLFWTGQAIGYVAQYPFFKLTIGRGAGWVAKGTMSSFAKGAKAITIDPLSKLAPHVSKTVATSWSASGVSAMQMGAKVAGIMATRSGQFLMWSPFIGIKTGQTLAALKTGVPLDVVVGSVMRDVVMTAGIVKGFQLGMREGSPLGVSKIAIDKKTIYTLRLGSKPAITKTAEGWIRGWPESESFFQRYYLAAAKGKGYAPISATSMVQAKLETKMLLRSLSLHLDKITPREAKKLAEALGLTRAVMGTKVTATGLDKIFREPFVRSKFSKAGTDEFMKLVENQRKKFLLFGSGSKAAQDPGKYILPEEYAAVGDIDQQFIRLGARRYVEKVGKIFGKTDTGKLVIRASEAEVGKITGETSIVHKMSQWLGKTGMGKHIGVARLQTLGLKKFPGIEIVPDVSVEAGTWKVATSAGERLLDVHGISSSYGAPMYPWALDLNIPPIKAGKFMATPLGKEVGTMWGPMSLQQVATADKTSMVMVWSRRAKDLFRGLRGLHTLSVAEWGEKVGVAKFAPTEAWIKQKLIMMGYGEAKFAGVMKEVMQEPLLLYAPQPTAFSYPGIPISTGRVIVTPSPMKYASRIPTSYGIEMPSLMSMLSSASRPASSLSSSLSRSSYPSKYPSPTSASFFSSIGSSLSLSFSSLSSVLSASPSMSSLSPSPSPSPSPYSYPPSYPPHYPYYPLGRDLGLSHFEKTFAPQISIRKLERFWRVGKIEKLFGRPPQMKKIKDESLGLGLSKIKLPKIELPKQLGRRR